MPAGVRLAYSHVVVLDSFLGELERDALLCQLTEPGWNPSQVCLLLHLVLCLNTPSALGIGGIWPHDGRDSRDYRCLFACATDSAKIPSGCATSRPSLQRAGPMTPHSASLKRDLWHPLILVAITPYARLKEKAILCAGPSRGEVGA